MCKEEQCRALLWLITQRAITIGEYLAWEYHFVDEQSEAEVADQLNDDGHQPPGNCLEWNQTNVSRALKRVCEHLREMLDPGHA